MKKLIAMFLVAVLILACGVSSADLDRKLIDHYNYCAYATAAPELDPEKAVVSAENPNLYIFPCGSYRIGFELIADNIIKTGAIYAKDDSCAADFLCSCMAMITYLGDTDVASFGMLCYQFSCIRAGFESIPSILGSDGFQMLPDDGGEWKYRFIYMNNDLTVND